MEKMKADKWSPEDISDELADEPELLKYLRLLPKGLWSRHFEKLEQMRAEKAPKGDATPVQERQINYLLGVLHARENAIEEYSPSDTFFKDKMNTKESVHAFGDALKTLLITNGNFLGAGQTARVKSMRLPGRTEKVAVKYLLTPTAKTLTVNAEHDMLSEVETELEIEEARKRYSTGENVRVPHPLFFYKRGILQCYGMDEIDGITLKELLEDKEYKRGKDEILSAAQSKFSTEEARAALFAEADNFMRAVHTVCLHGDIKLANLMIDRTGRLYLIDFGQSVHMRGMQEKTRPQFENLMDHEREQVQICLQRLFNDLRHAPLEKAAA